MVDIQRTGSEDDAYEVFEIDTDDIVFGNDEPSEVNLPSKIARLFTSIEELNAAIAYITGTPETREEIRENPKYLGEEQFEFLNEIILSPITKGNFEEIKLTISLLKEAVLNVFKKMAEED